jgi:Cu/Ag efflux pump CusA
MDIRRLIVATVLGLVPMAIGGPGSETYAPLARAVIGGLTVSTLLTLLLVPVLFVIVEKRLRRRPTDDAELDDSGPGPALRSEATP